MFGALSPKNMSPSEPPDQSYSCQPPKSPPQKVPVLLLLTVTPFLPQPHLDPVVVSSPYRRQLLIVEEIEEELRRKRSLEYWITPILTVSFPLSTRSTPQATVASDPDLTQFLGAQLGPRNSNTTTLIICSTASPQKSNS